ncbi:MAG TPA: hypothetical protein VFI22_03430 [Thermomicrobiales bacterium]|nr:hypothetical protein [Thermomicrobiales bacterium]
MSYPYPEDRTRAKRTKGQQPYKDARQRLAENEVELETEAEEYGEANQSEAGRETGEAMAESLRHETRRIIREREKGDERPER